jgi:mono/diheme cytochrome c family protein
VIRIQPWPLILAGLSASAFAQPAAPAAALKQYCLTCHNPELRTADLVLDPADLANVGTKPEQWEKVVAKLRTNAMPPAGMPRPDQATYNSVATYLETELDRAAAAKPNPGKLPLLHRLSRTEYENAIRDLLAVDALPKELDYSLLLPPDNSSSGFDNIADLLFVSPAIMERYLDAARKISRLAVGDPGFPVMINSYRLSPEQTQDTRVDALPIGTRGGLGVRSYFPLDGEYSIKFELAGAARDAQQIEVSIDGERIQLAGIGNAGGGGRGGGGDKPLEVRFPVKAGSRLVGVAFVERDEARDEATVRPRMRGRGSQPALLTVTISGPYAAEGPGDTAARRRIFVCRPANAAVNTEAETPCARKILSTLVRRAYRRPAMDSDLADLMPFYTEGRSSGGFDMGIQKALERLLVSPQFLFRIEREPAGIAKGSAYRIGDLELASRLSFFLWSSIPDDELLDTAAAGKLKDPAVLERETRRMLADPRSESLVTNFAAQWLFLRDVELKQPDVLLFPDFDDGLRYGFERETELFVDSILRENRSVLELLSANYTFINDRLAKQYGIPNIEGSYFRRYTFPDGSPRGGLLGQGSILTLTSYSTRTSAVVRGKWVLENLLNAAPPPPPPNIPALKTEGKKAGETLSMREAMTQHRANPSCATCHARMDPIGFAMENFDAVGRWRDSDNGKAIDTSGMFTDGSKFDGIAGLKKVLLAHPEQFVHTVAGKLMMYGVGRNLQYFDEPSIRSVVHDAARDNYTFASLILGIVKSTPFQMRQAQ